MIRRPKKAPEPGLRELPEGGDEEALLTSLAPKVRGWLFRHIGQGPDLDDAVQEALIEIAGALDHFEGRAAFTTYAHRIAVRVASRHRRRYARRVPPLGLAPATEERRDPESVAMHRESLRRLYRALDRLSEKRRAAFVLCAIEKLPHTEAAVILEVSVETLRARLKHARAELGRLLAHDPYLGPFFGETR